MTLVPHVFPSWTNAALAKTVSPATDTLQVLLVASGSYAWNSTAQAAVTVHDFLTANGTLAEVSTSGTAYSRLNLSTVSVADSGAYTSLIVGTNPAWASATFSCVYACFFDNTVGGTDSTNQLIGYWDFGVTETVTANTFTLQMGAGGAAANCLAQWQSS